jgi:hypothetical protein
MDAKGMIAGLRKNNNSIVRFYFIFAFFNKKTTSNCTVHYSLASGSTR